MYMLLGNWQDKLAWESLSGRIGKEEIIRRSVSDANKGKIISEDMRKKLSYANKGEKNCMYGKKHSEESLKKMRKKHPSISGKNHPMYGKHFSEESRKKMGE